MGLLFLALKYPEHEGLEERNIMHTWEEERKHYYRSNGFLIPFLELWMAFEHSKAGRLLCMIIGRLWFSYTPQKYLHNGKCVGAPHFLSLFLRSRGLGLSFFPAASAVLEPSLESLVQQSSERLLLTKKYNFSSEGSERSNPELPHTALAKIVAQRRAPRAEATAAFELLTELRRKGQRVPLCLGTTIIIVKVCSCSGFSKPIQEIAEGHGFDLMDHLWSGKPLIFSVSSFGSAL